MYSVNDIQFKYPEISGLKTRVASLGEGPAVVFLHGWPESWYSWRSQMVAVANNGFQAIAPDMPGFGETGKFAQIEDYNTKRIGEFILELIESEAGKNAIVVAHDWGAVHGWNFTLQHPQAVSRLITMSVPLRPQGTKPPTQVYRDLFGDRFFYQLYFQKPGVAEKEFDADPHGIISRLLCSPDTPREQAILGSSWKLGGGWIDRLGKTKELPSWMTQEELDYYVEAFTKSGFEGGIHYYRNLDRNWEIMNSYADQKITCPVLFIAGSDDISIVRASSEDLQNMMSSRVPDLTVKVMPGYGHWIQNEAAEEVNKDLLSFIQT
ncbi:MAG: alpha/beta fold hydrolase [Methyloligellaceae bacterium]